LNNSFSQPTLAVVLTKTYCFTFPMMSPKEKSTDIVTSSVNFESFPENFTLHSRHQCYKTFIHKISSFRKLVTTLIHKRRFLQRHLQIITIF